MAKTDLKAAALGIATLIRLYRQRGAPIGKPGIGREQISSCRGVDHGV